MKKIFALLTIVAVCTACSSPNHHVKYSNGNEDFYIHEKNSTDYTITMVNGDNTDGTLKVSVIGGIDKIENCAYFKNWLKENKGHSIDDAIVRFVKSSWIDAHYQLANPATAKFNLNLGTIGVTDGKLILLYDVFCKNGFGTEGKVTVNIEFKDLKDTEYNVTVL